MRLFVSVDLPDALAAPVRAVQDAMREAPGLTFTDPAQAHFTLKFLGETEPAGVEALESAIDDAVADADVAPFEVALGGLGAFPSTDYIRVVWIGVTAGGEPLTRLHDAIESRTVALGFDPEPHDFTPHVTLARMEHAGGKERVQRVIADGVDELGSMAVDDVRLTESRPGPDGPEYSTVSRHPL